MRKLQRLNIAHHGEHNAAFNQGVRGIVQKMLQHATPEPIGYKPARVDGGSPITRTSKWARHIKVLPIKAATTSRFKTDDLEVYEQMMFGCLAWGDYSTYVITGEMGSGKTSVARWIREVLERERTELCSHCRAREHCSPVVIYKDFNTYGLVDSIESIKSLFKRDLLALVLSVLRPIFSGASEVERFRLAVIHKPTEGDLSRFAGFISHVSKTHDWANLAPEQKADRLLRYVERDLADDDRRDLDEQLLYAMTLVAYVRRELRQDSACMVFIFDNIDGVRADAQLALLKIILAAQETAHVKTLVPLRNTTFEKWETNAAFVFGHVDHAGAGPMEIVRQRLSWWQEAWNVREEVHALDPIFRDALKRRLDYFLSLWDTSPRTIDALGALSGASIRLGLYLMERVFLNNVVRFDEEAHYHAEILRAVLVDNSTSEIEMSAQDLYVHNLFASPVDNSFSLVSLRILQVVYALKDRAGERTVRNVLRTVQTADTDYADNVVWRGLNMLLFQNAPLLWVDGRYEYGSPQEALDSFDVLSITEAGRRYFEILLRDLMYVQEALMSVSWPVDKVGRYIDYRRANSRFNGLRDCLRHLMNVDTLHIASWSDGQNRRAAHISVDGEFVSNRIAYNIARAVLGVIKKSEFDNPGQALTDWKNLLTLGFNNEWDTLKHENLKLVELVDHYDTEINSRRAGPVEA